MSDFTAATLDRAWHAWRGGHPWPAWSQRETLAVALVLGDRAVLASWGYTPQQAAQAVYDGMARPPRDFVAWLNGIRAELNSRMDGVS